MKRYDIVIPFVALTWAGSFIAVKIGVRELSPVQIAFLRFAVASPFMLLVVFLKKKKMRMPLNEFPALIVLACLFSQVHFLSSRAYISPRTDRLKYAFALKL